MKLVMISVLLITAAAAVFVMMPDKNSKDMTARQRILKKIYPLIMKTSKANGKSSSDSTAVSQGTDFYSLKFLLNDGTSFEMNTLKGRKVMIVNTASDCGYTGQYADLQKLYDLHKDKLTIIAFPANDFANQESGSDEKIAGFCKKNYGISFPLAKKGVVIKNNEQQEVYKWLTNKGLNGWNEQEPTWNFCKYIIDENGKLTNFFNSAVNPMGDEMLKALGL